jgi:replicative DNA helicase
MSQPEPVGEPWGEPPPDDRPAVSPFRKKPSQDDNRFSEGGGGFERVPPQDLDAEQSVLGGMLLSKDAIADVVEVLKGADFYRPAHETIFTAILDLYARGEPADPITAAAELTKRGEIARVGGAPYLHTLVNAVPTAANAEYYAEIVHERAVLRRLVEAGTRITQMGYAADGDVDDIVNNAQAEIYAVTEQRTSEDYLPLGDIMEGALDEIEAIGSRSGQMSGVPTGFADLDSLTNGLHPGQMIVIAARPAMGKALALDTVLPTPGGWTTMGAVRTGDHLIAADGTPTRVVAATGVMTGRPCYEVTFDDGTTVVADADHEWLTDTGASRRPARESGPDRRGIHPSVKTTREIAATLRRTGTADRRVNHTVRNAAPLDLADRALPVPPYTLGAWLGGGHRDAAKITSADPEVVRRIAAEGVRAEHSGEPVTYALGFAADQPEPVRGSGGTSRQGTVLTALRDLGVLGIKHIPQDYLRGSLAQRRALLAGLLDTGGTVTDTGSVRSGVTERALAEGLCELLTSLGHRCGMVAQQVEGCSESASTGYAVTFTTDDDVFAIERKRRTHADRRRPGTAGLSQRAITAVREIESVPVRCVQVDNPEHMYLATASMVPTHNSTLALDFARTCSIAHKMPSVIFSLEMGRNEIAMRLLSAEARVALHHMRSGTMTDDDWTKVARRMPDVTEAPLYIDDSPNLSMMEIRAKCRRLKQRNDLRLVVIDYLQLMQSGGSRRPESRQQEVSDMSRNLKLLAKELEVPVIALSQLNRGPEQRTDKKPMVSDLRESGCVTAGTRLLRADTGAETTMGELMTSGARDVPVWSVDEHLKLVPRSLTHAFASGVKEAFRVRLESGREVEATANHPFLTYDGWQPLGSLAVGARVAVPRRIDPPARTAARPEAEVAMLAHLLGGGHAAPGRPVHRASGDQADLRAVQEAAARRESFGLSSRQPHERYLPQEVFGLPDEQVRFFLRHLWANGGSVTRAKDGAVGVSYATASEQLARDVQQLLLRLDLCAGLRRAGAAGGRPRWSVDISGADDQRAFLRQVGVPGTHGEAAEAALLSLDAVAAGTTVDTVPHQVWERVRDAMREREATTPAVRTALGVRRDSSARHRSDPNRAGLPRVAEVLRDADLEMLATSDVSWDPIVSIESIGEQPVYDATVPGTHNFIANGVVLHNSIEQDADMVILLHREDAYEKESPRAGEADLIVAKHRNGPTATITVAFQGHYSRFVDMAQT